MAPTAVYEEPLARIDFSKSDLSKVKNAPYAYRNDTWAKPVADDFMYAFKYNAPLPTHDNAGVATDFTQDEEKDARATADGFLERLEQVIQSRDATAFAGLFLDCGECAGVNLLE